MKSRRRRAGRKRKVGAKRYPSGKVVNETTLPPDEVLAKRRAAFGSEKVQAETDWVIDQLWGERYLDDRQRQAALRLRALISGRLARISAPREAAPASMAGGSSRGPTREDDDGVLDQEHLAALGALSRLHASGYGEPLNVREWVIGAVVFNVCSPKRHGVIRWALGHLADHFERPKHQRLESADALAPRA